MLDVEEMEEVWWDREEGGPEIQYWENHIFVLERLTRKNQVINVIS